MMRSKKKRLRRSVKSEAMAGLRPISAADLIELLKGAEGLEATARKTNHVAEKQQRRPK